MTVDLKPASFQAANLHTVELKLDVSKANLHMYTVFYWMNLHSTYDSHSFFTQKIYFDFSAIVCPSCRQMSANVKLQAQNRCCNTYRYSNILHKYVVMCIDFLSHRTPFNLLLNLNLFIDKVRYVKIGFRNQ